MDTNGTRRRLLQLLATASAVNGFAWLQACGGGGGTAVAAPPPVSGDEDIATSLGSITPQNQAATFRNVDRLAATRPIRRGTQVLALPAHARSLETTLAPQVDAYMARNRTAGLLVLKGGEIALERYGMGNTAQSKWTSFSVAKSLTSTLVGAALRSGRIASLDDPVSAYAADLGTEWAKSSVRDLLSMSSGMRWIEDYTGTGDSDIARLSAAIGTPGAVRELLRSRTRATASGQAFNYSTGESCVLGAVVAGATGKDLSTVLSDAIWAPLGMEADGYWLLDAAGGLELGGSNFSATLRDYGRFGLFFLCDGTIAGQRVLPEGWRDLAGRPQTAQTAYGQLHPGDSFGYGYQWWAFPGGAFTAQGIYGQFLYIDPAEDLVAVVWSAWSETWNVTRENETYQLIRAARDALR